MTRQNYVFTSESVSEGHPDKVCDRISDAVLDAFIAEDALARVACEAFATTNRLSPMDIGVQVYWLQARYLAAGGRLDATSRNLAESILAQQPDIPVVTEMLALDAFHSGDAAAAVALCRAIRTEPLPGRGSASQATRLNGPTPH